MKLLIEDDVKERYPDLIVLLTRIDGVKVLEGSEELEEFKEEVYRRIREKHRLETLKDEPILRAYRDFFWKLGIDPTKIRPSAEALLRRILGGRGIPKINTLVDSYNLASAESCIALAAFDVEKIEGDLVMRFARSGETFLGIGMREPKTLRGGEVVISDSKRLVAIYPYRDADYSKVTLETKSIYLMVCGVPKIPLKELERAESLAKEYVMRFCGGYEVKL